MCRTLEGQNLSLSILDAILLTERKIVRELELLMEMKAYPSAELVLIRKEVKAFKEQQEFILSKSAENSTSKGEAAALLQREATGNSAGAGTSVGAGNGANASDPQMPPTSVSAAALGGDDVAIMLSSGYDDLVAILSAENKLCERKLLMMGSRRQEEEERRALFMKKIARAKAMEDNQARDPANFRNQLRF